MINTKLRVLIYCFPLGSISDVQRIIFSVLLIVHHTIITDLSNTIFPVLLIVHLTIITDLSNTMLLLLSNRYRVSFIFSSVMFDDTNKAFVVYTMLLLLSNRYRISFIFSSVMFDDTNKSLYIRNWKIKTLRCPQDW